jgi:superfamily I DNA/RNA helicase
MYGVEDDSDVSQYWTTNVESRAMMVLLMQINRFRDLLTKPPEKLLDLIRSSLLGYWNDRYHCSRQGYDEAIQVSLRLVELSKGDPNLETFYNRMVTPVAASATGVLLTTIDGYKGKENRVVYIYGVAPGVFPMSNGDYAEELRRAYVAVTRPQQELRLVIDPLYPKAFYDDHIIIRHAQS